MSREDLIPGVREVKFDEGTLDLRQMIDALRRQLDGAAAEPEVDTGATVSHVLPRTGATGALNTAQFRLLQQNPVLTAVGHDPAPRVPMPQLVR